MTEESLHPLAFGAAILLLDTECNTISLQPQFLRPIVGALGSSACVESLRHPLPALPAKDAQADEAGGKESEGTSWVAPPGCMRPGGGMLVGDLLLAPSSG